MVETIGFHLSSLNFKLGFDTVTDSLECMFKWVVYCLLFMMLKSKENHDWIPYHFHWARSSFNLRWTKIQMCLNVKIEKKSWNRTKFLILAGINNISHQVDIQFRTLNSYLKWQPNSMEVKFWIWLYYNNEITLLRRTCKQSIAENSTMNTKPNILNSFWTEHRLWNRN